MLAASVDPGKGLFVKQADKPVLLRNVAEHLHRQLVVVGGNVCRREDRCKLVLCRRNLVVLGLCKNPQLPQLVVDIAHECRNTGLYRTEIVIVKLLTLRRFGTEKGSAGVYQILAPVEQFNGNKEIFLLRADRRLYRGDIVVPEQPENSQRLLVDPLHRTQKRSLFVKRLAAVGAERRRYAERLALYESIGRGVPRGIASCLECGAETAGGEGGGIGLAAHKLFSGELHYDLSVIGGTDEAVVLLGGDAGHGLEPVGEMGRTLFDSPVLHCVCHNICHLKVEMFSVFYGALHCPVGFLRQLFLHRRVAEDERAEFFCYTAHE